MKLHQNMERIHSSYWIKLWGNSLNWSTVKNEALQQFYLLSSKKISTVLTIPAQSLLHFSKDMANQCPFFPALSPPGCTHQSHLTPSRLQIKGFSPSYITIISVLIKFLTSVTSLAFAPCKNNKEKRAGGFLSTVKGSSNPATFGEGAEIAYK